MMVSATAIQPGPHDVLCGRGSGSNNYIGNKRFRKLVDERREEYVSTAKHTAKKQIANELVGEIHSRGGRFLCLYEDERTENSSNIVDDGVWVEAAEKVAQEKVKQSLREKRGKINKEQARKTKKRPKPAPKRKSPDLKTETFSLVSDDGDECAPERVESVARAPQSLPFFEESSPFVQNNVQPPHSSSTVQSTLIETSFQPVVDARLQLYRSSPVRYSQFHLLQPSSAEISNLPLDPFNSYFGSNSESDMLQSFSSIPPSHRQHTFGVDTVQSFQMYEQQQQSVAFASGNPNIDYELDKKASPVDITPLPKEAPFQEEEVSEFLLSALSLSGRERISEEQEALEKARLTDSEKAEALADMFGEMCTLDHQPGKRLKKGDLDSDSLHFLVRHMRAELDRIPAHDKQALLIAQEKAHPREFSDERLVTFLRCEGMNTKLAAQRFVNYWDCRREVFGKDDYTLRMTLAEALKDDLVALEAGLIYQLPYLDLSGRQLIYVEPRRHTREGYTSKSMSRALWYAIEAVAEDSKAMDATIVQVLWDKHSTMFDYDKKVHDRLNFYRDHAWPVRVAAIHDCCPPKFVNRVLKPILMALKTKSTRSRTLFHDVPSSDILNVLADYGILPAHLPVDMGGTVHLNQQKWIENRWATELEEI